VDFKVNVYSFDGEELVPCAVEKAKELCEKGKAELFENGTAIRLLNPSPRDVSVLRVKQLTHLLTTKNITEHKLHRINLLGSRTSGKSHAILHVIKTLSSVQVDAKRLSNVIVLHHSTINLKLFLDRLNSAYPGNSNSSSFLSFDYESADMLYYLNRNDIFNGQTIKTNVLKFVPIATAALNDKEMLSKRLNLLSGPYVVLSDDLQAEPTSDAYNDLLDKAHFVMTTTTVEELTEVRLHVSYK
jgi:hypothetical protein